MESHKVKIEAKAIPCPKCSNGNLLPFLKAVHSRGATFVAGREPAFDHYEVYYRCSNCNHTVEGNSFF